MIDLCVSRRALPQPSRDASAWCCGIGTENRQEEEEEKKDISGIAIHTCRVSLLFGHYSVVSQSVL